MLMKTRAPNVYRWTERMNLANIADGEFPDCPETYLADDKIPATLKAVLRLVFSDWGPGLRADASCFNAWVERQPALNAGHPISADDKHRVHPTLGPVEYAWRGITMRRASAPHGLWHFERAAGFARGLSGDGRARLDDLLRRTGGTELMTIRLSRQLKRENYSLVIA
jgi:hypothetical protein